MKRREFIKMGAAFILLDGCIKPTAEPIKRDFKDNILLFAAKGKMRMFTPGTGRIQDLFIPENFTIHSFEKNPNNHGVICLTEKWGNKIMTYDLVKRKFVKLEKLKGGFEFLGHHLYSPDGKYIYATCTSDYRTGYQGYLVKFHADTLDEIGRFPTQGVAPHQFKYINNQKEFIILNAGIAKEEEFISQCNISIFDINSEKIIETITTPERVTVTHLDGDDENFYCIGKKIYSDENIKGIGFAFAYNKQEGIRPFPQHEQQKDVDASFLSCAISKKHNILALTSYFEDMIFFYDAKKLTPISAISMPIPMTMAISNDQEKFYVGARNNGVYEIDVKTQKILRKIDNIGNVGIGSHNIVL